MSDFKHQLLLAMALNLGLKVVTFSLTVKQTRLLLPEQSGIAFTYMVYTDAVMFLAREAVRSVASRLPLTAAPPTNGGGAVKQKQEDKNTATAAAATKEDEATSTLSMRPDKNSTTATIKYDAAAIARVVQFASLAIPIACLVMLLFELIHALLGLHQLPSLGRTAKESYHRLLTADDMPKNETTTTTTMTTANTSHTSIFFQFNDAAYVAQQQQHHATPLQTFYFYLPELLVVLSIVLNALAEPCMVLVLSLDLFRAIVVSEFWELFARLTTVIGLLTLLGGTFRSEWEARMAFALGQLAYGGVHLLCFVLISSGRQALARWGGGGARLAEVRAAALTSTATTAAVGRRSLSCLLPFPWCCGSLRGTAHMLRAQLALFTSFVQESLLRLVLTEGESFALTSVGSRAARGNYQVVSQLGSLVARLVFRVWENACFARWSRDLAAGRAAEAVALLQLILRLAFYFGFSFVLLGPPLAQWFLTVLYTSRWSSPATVSALRLYCYAIAFMSWNGLLEAFLRAAASPAMVRRLQKRMLLFSCVYVGVCYVAIGHWADEAVCSLILLNAINMCCRIGSSLHLALRCTTAEGAPILTLRDVTHILDAKMLVALALLLGLSRAVPPSPPSMVTVGGLYVAVVLAGDRTMREVAGTVLRRVPVARRWRLWQVPGPTAVAAGGGRGAAGKPAVTM